MCGIDWFDFHRNFNYMLQQLKESRIVNESVYSTMIMKAFRKFLERLGKIGARLWCSLALLGRDKHLKYKRTRKP